MATNNKTCEASNLTPENSPKRFYSKSCSGKPLQSSARRNILNVYAQLREENPKDSINATVQKTARLTGVSRTTVFKIRSVAKAGGAPSTPGKKRPGAVGKRTRLTRYDEFSLSALRRKVHDYFRRNEIPTLKKLLSDLKEEEDIFQKNISMSTLHRLLRDLGFSFNKRSRSSALIEKTDVILKRRRYLREIKKHRKDGRDIYYLDETWANGGHTNSRVWQDTTIESSYQASSANLTTGLKAPSGKGKRVIVTHAGSVDGFVEGAAEVFHAKKSSGDYHEEMDGTHFEKWFKEKLLPNIKPNSVVVIDNAPYHTVKVEQVPTTSWRKQLIQEWLTSKNLPWTSDMLKAELLETVSSVREKYTSYRIDTIASLSGHTILRLPPYHCELNPIELIWSQVKGYIAKNNRSFTLKEVEKLAWEGIALVTSENWKNCIQHVIAEEEKFWKIDGLVDDVMDKQSLIINLQESSDDSDSTSFGDSDEMSGIEELENL